MCCGGQREGGGGGDETSRAERRLTNHTAQVEIEQKVNGKY